MEEDKIIKKEDYEEPACPFCFDSYKKGPVVNAVPQRRIIEKLDEYLAKNDYFAAERHLLYWLNEAVSGNDGGGELLVRNELMGIYRKTGKKEQAINNALAATLLTDELALKASVSQGTTFVNAATVYKAFGMADKALPLFERALEIFSAKLSSSDAKLGGLYNNMALALADIKRYKDAREHYMKALQVMQNNKNAEGEQAITWLNLANLAEYEYGAEKGEKEIEYCLAKALELLDAPTLPHDGNYAFICEKCAPTFGYYGHFATEKALSDRAKKIYEGT